MRADRSSPETLRDRDLLVTASGDIDLPPRLEARELDEHDYMASWEPDLALRADAVGAVSFAGPVRGGSPETMESSEVLDLEPGDYGVVLIRIRDGGYEQAVVIRQLGVTVSSWQLVGRAHDWNYLVIAVDADFDKLLSEWESERAFDTIVAEHTGDEHPFVWIENPSGNGVKAFAGLSAAGRVVALFFELF